MLLVFAVIQYNEFWQHIAKLVAIKTVEWCFDLHTIVVAFYLPFEMWREMWKYIILIIINFSENNLLNILLKLAEKNSLIQPNGFIYFK